MVNYIKELQKKYGYIVYEYADDERTNTNEKYIIYDALNNKYIVRINNVDKIVNTLVEARELRNKILKKERIEIVERD
ncbi:MAG: hypothetical protein K6D97_08665 [Clostridia bacterium]|nr:hypothetical protein [Clostridia bacterium]